MKTCKTCKHWRRPINNNYGDCIVDLEIEEPYTLYVYEFNSCPRWEGYDRDSRSSFIYFHRGGKK